MLTDPSAIEQRKPETARRLAISGGKTVKLEFAVANFYPAEPNALEGSGCMRKNLQTGRGQSP